MTATAGILALVGDPSLRADVDRVAAAVGVPVVHATDPSGRNAWSAAAAVVLDASAAGRCAHRALPRRARVVLIVGAEPHSADFQAAIAVGAQQIITLPVEDGDLMTALANAAEACRDGACHGAVIGVIAGRGGAGASVFSTALAHAAAAASDALLVDADPWGGGIDLVLGCERDSGLRWPELSLQGGRLNYPALREALPHRHGVRVLSGGRLGVDIDAAPISAVLDAGSRGGATVICDLPRRSTSAVEAVLDVADLVVVITPADVRSCAAAAAIGPWVSAANPNAGVVVRGPSPGGLSARDVAEIVGLPLLATMRAEPRVADALECGGLRLRRRSPLAAAARQVLAVLHERRVSAA
ncbi:septum site-determining protein Ssd [Mycobacterium sp. NPDC048908]|uniref:septum site-determining protein Ssd n=1 Tax=Mycobacterium sp. NPDC048908 TaxID=3364292 RepID=UPI0037247858